MSGAKLRVRAWGAISAVVLTLSAPAAAQYYYPANPAFPPPPPPTFGFMPLHEADAVVRSLGLNPVAPARPHGPVIFVDALGQEGSLVRVTIDRRTGRVRQIVRIGQGAPQIATAQPGYLYEGAEEEDGAPGYTGNAPGPYSPGPSVITREGIQAEDLPPPGTAREADITGSIPRTVRPGPVDPLLGVPEEFRGRARSAPPPRPAAKLAARTPDDAVPHTAPLPRPRPADVPAVAQRDPSPPAPPARGAGPAPAAPTKSDGSEAVQEFPVQPLE